MYSWLCLFFQPLEMKRDLQACAHFMSPTSSHFRFSIVIELYVVREQSFWVMQEQCDSYSACWSGFLLLYFEHPHLHFQVSFGISYSDEFYITKIFYNPQRPNILPRRWFKSSTCHWGTLRKATKFRITLIFKKMYRLDNLSKVDISFPKRFYFFVLRHEPSPS